MALNNDEIGILTSGIKALGETGSSILKAAQVIGLSTSLFVVAPYALTFYYLYRRLFKNRLDKLSTDKLRVTIERVSVDASKKQGEVDSLRNSVKLLEEDSGNMRNSAVIKSDLRNARERLSLAESQLEELITAKEFAGSVMLLLQRRDFLLKNGIWNELNKISNKKLEADNEKIIQETLNIRQMKDYLLEINGNQEMYKEIMRV